MCLLEDYVFMNEIRKCVLNGQEISDSSLLQLYSLGVGIQ